MCKTGLGTAPISRTGTYRTYPRNHPQADRHENGQRCFRAGWNPVFA